MNKFFEVFNTLKVPEEIGVYLTDTEVTRVSKTSTNSLARVYLSSERLISKQVIYKAEDALKKQIFRMKNMDVRIIDRYRLSKQYTPVKIMEIYYDSILFELEKYWTLEYNLLKNSQWEFDGEHCLVLTLEDGFLSRTYADTLADYFKKIFLNRFGFEIDVIYKYAKKEGSHYELENEHKLNLRVAQIEKNMRAAQAAGDGVNEDSSKTAFSKGTSTSSKSENAASSGTKSNDGVVQENSRQSSFGDKNRTQFGQKGSQNEYYKKKPSNPDVLYGRDFDEEPMPIEQVDSALGEIVIAGMIRKVDEREIRNERTILMFDLTDFTDTITVKMFIANAQLPEVKEYIKKGNFIKVKGVAALDRYDQEISITSVWGIRKSQDNREVRNDLSLHKSCLLYTSPSPRDA